MSSERIRVFKNRLDSEFDVSTISNCSWDDAQSVTLVSNVNLPVYNFDSIVQRVTEQTGRFLTPSSVDGLYIDDVNLIFIEFKNQIWSKIKSSDVQLKVHESIALLKLKYGLRDEDFHGSTVYIVHRPNPDTPSTHRHFHSLRTPDKYKFIEAVFNLNVIRYRADDFEKELMEQKVLPLTRL
ncbi:hypothetical protein [Exiguobacterium sp. TNDT2]|uniref:hypothetical protein n=1 Tax=Exiguobacterium sp. TNDT2 TaxID=2233531 RepID=UPI000DEF33FB|nr:hypothetical protein [Exiguobacterium sp. TNDT2]